jgi:hypothetical protein
VSGKWTPRWVYHRGTPGLAAQLIPYCTKDGGPANKVHPPDDGQILAPASDFEGFKERLIRQGAEVLGQRAYETVMCDLPLVTPRWDEADPKVRAAFINQARGSLVNFVLPAIEEAASENPESTEEGKL